MPFKCPQMQVGVPRVCETNLPGATFSLSCLPSRISQHPLVPTPILGLLLLLLLSILLLSQSPPPTWPHLQLYYLQPPPV